MRTKIDKNKNWMIQSIFGKVGLNIYSRREEKKKKISPEPNHIFVVYRSPTNMKRMMWCFNCHCG
jgi:hypothetical protein